MRDIWKAVKDKREDSSPPFGSPADKHGDNIQTAEPICRRQVANPQFIALASREQLLDVTALVIARFLEKSER